VVGEVRARRWGLAQEAQRKGLEGQGDVCRAGAGRDGAACEESAGARLYVWVAGRVHVFGQVRRRGRGLWDGLSTSHLPPRTHPFPTPCAPSRLPSMPTAK
jgi:hypothetical protein